MEKGLSQARGCLSDIDLGSLPPEGPSGGRGLGSGRCPLEGCGFLLLSLPVCGSAVSLALIAFVPWTFGDEVGGE